MLTIEEEKLSAIDAMDVGQAAYLRKVYMYTGSTIGIASTSYYLYRQLSTLHLPLIILLQQPASLRLALLLRYFPFHSYLRDNHIHKVNQQP